MDDAALSLNMNIHCYSCTLINALKKKNKGREREEEELGENYGFEEIIQRNIFQKRVKA